MTFEFDGLVIVEFDMDPSEFEGLQREEIADELLDIAVSHAEDTRFEYDQFLSAADEILAALEDQRR